MPAEERAIQRHIERLFVASYRHAIQAFDCLTSHALARSSRLWATATCHVPACARSGLAGARMRVEARLAGNTRQGRAARHAVDGREQLTHEGALHHAAGNVQLVSLPCVRKFPS